MVPMDARIAVTFGRSVHDGAKVGSYLQAIVPDSESIGDPSNPNGSVLKVRYVLDTVTLERKVGSGWETVAASPKSTGSTTPTLWGQWSVVPQLPDTKTTPPPNPGQTKLLLGAKTPFEFNRHTGASWEEWVSDALPGYPCIPVQPGKENCFGFGGLEPQSTVMSPWTFPGPPAVTLSWGFGPATVGTRTVTRDGVIQKIPLLCFPEAAVRRGIRVQPGSPGARFRLILAQADSQTGPVVDPQPIQPGPNPGTRGSDTEPAPDPMPLGPGDPISPRRGSGDVTELTGEAKPTCVDMRARVAGTLANPWQAEEGARFTVRGADGALLPVARIERWGEGGLGLNAGFELDIDLPCPAAWVTLLVTHRPPFRIVAFNAAGMAVATHAPNGQGGTSTETIRLDGPAITRVVVYASGNEKLIHQVCFLCPRPVGPQATGFGVDGTPFGPFSQFEGTISVVGPEIHDVVITDVRPFCLEQICITPDPEAGQVVRQDERIQHQIDELARWQAEGEVLAPDSFYRVTVKTRLDLDPDHPSLDGLPGDLSPVEHAYFRTGGPPGLTALSKPEGITTDPFATGLEDLTLYVRETTPPTVPPPGEKPILYKPFYRAYDVGLEFNEDYVEQMYRMDRRDLGLYLYDANNQPARDGLGRLLALSGEWGKAETLSLLERETRWITMIDAASCLPKKLDPQTFPKDDALASVEPGRVLAPDTLHEARLVPLLLHEAFQGNVLGQVPGGWYAEDSGPGGSSSWKVGEVGEPPSRFVEQVSTIGGAASPDRPGTLLLLAGAAGWTDYRLSVYLRAPAGAVGVVVRYQGPGTGYRLSLDDRARRLVKGGTILLAEDHVAYRKNRDSLVTVEAIGSSLRCYVDGEPVFEVEDGDFAAGGIGLYSCQSPGARFTDVRVDDLGKTAPVVYRFQLTTSLYANYFHHVHSYQDETWKLDLGGAADVAGLLQQAVPASFAAPTEAEARAYEDLAGKALGAAARQNPQRVEFSRVESAGATVALLVRSPEPLAWDRMTLALSRALHLAVSQPPGAVKLVDAGFGFTQPDEESVTLLLREAVDLSRHRIELRSLPGALAEPAGDPVLYLERFQGDPQAARDRFEVVDLATASGASDWRVEGGALIQVSEIAGGAEPELPGTVALTGDPQWTDYRLVVDLRSDSGEALGVVCRWLDGDNYYRLSLDANRKYRRLIKSEQGQVSILWEDDEAYAVGEPFRLTIEAVGSRLSGFLGSERLFEVRDSTHAAGRVGLYASGNPDARCEAIEVRRPSLDAYALLRDRFAAGDLAGWNRVDEAAGTAPSSMEVSGGELRLASFVQQGGSPEDPGSYAYAGDGTWTDAVYSARLRCPSGGTLGLVFRGRDLKNYYRFAMNAQQPYRRLVKRVDGNVTVLWEDGGAYDPGSAHEVTVVAVGGSLRGYVDGVPVFAVEDGDIGAGFIGLYSRDNAEARFSQVRVFPADVVRLGESDWTLWYAFGAEDPLPAGTRVRISAGPGTNVVSEAGVEHRAAAPLGEAGRLRFAADGAELRIVTPQGSGHARSFVPITAYTILPPPRVLRRADGAGLFLVPDDGSPWTEGQYRLSFSYDRERGTEVHPFSQAGDRSPERVQIDVPWSAFA
jgi:3-keto-disaccharide hydrolase